MDSREYQRHLGEIGFGKRLPTALDVCRGDAMQDGGPALNELLARLVAGYAVGPEFNVIKIPSGLPPDSSCPAGCGKTLAR